MTPRQHAIHERTGLYLVKSDSRQKLNVWWALVMFVAGVVLGACLVGALR